MHAFRISALGNNGKIDEVLLVFLIVDCDDDYDDCCRIFGRINAVEEDEALLGRSLSGATAVAGC